MKHVHVRINFSSLKKARVRLECPHCQASFEFPAEKLPESLACPVCDGAELYGPDCEPHSEADREKRESECRARMGRFVHHFRELLAQLPGFLPDKASDDSYGVGSPRISLMVEAEVPDPVGEWLALVKAR